MSSVLKSGSMKVQLNVRVEEIVRERLRLLAATDGDEIGEVVARLVTAEWDTQKDRVIARVTA